ncbi:uncharacterized protein JCM6883_004380, partial [Sporobolomyces salmoneus]|uniref:uncharacterized protein n=1 Tax=Sporobolomyces salmoneus TaxID=183962 RepID=UPI00317D8A43
GEYLEPIDLLHLTRVNKSLRRLFTSKQDSARIWKIAYRNVEFPTLTATDWDLVRLASLLHDTPLCIACGSKTGSIKWDLACRMFRHEGCSDKIFSTSAEILDQIATLHPETLSCVLSRRVGTGRETRNMFVTSQIEPMNDYLFHLDSDITASRDRNVRKAAREARDAFVAERKRIVDARFEDEKKLMNWSTGYAERSRQAQAARKRVEAERKQARIQERIKEVKTRARSLACHEEVLAWIAKHSLVRIDKPLDESEWTEISSILNEREEERQRNLAIRQLAATRVELVTGYYSYFEQREQDTHRLSCRYSKEDFQNFVEVKKLAAALAVIGDPLWTEVLPSIERILAKKRLAVKLAYARPLAAAYSAAGRPLSANFLSALFPLGGSQIGASGWKVNLDFPNILVDHSTALENQLDELFSRFTSQIFCGHIERHRVESSPDIEIARSSNRPHNSGVSVSLDWLRILFAILAATGVEDGSRDETSAQLEALGPCFQCRFGGCGFSNGFRMTFSRLLNHVSQSVVHSRAFNPYYAENPHPVSVIAYVPRAPVSNATPTSS